MTRLVASLLAALLLAACAQVGGRSRLAASEEERRAYGRAVAAVRKDPARGEALLLEFAKSHPASSLADDAVARLAEIALARGDEKLARDRFRWIVDHHPGGDRADLARLRLAELASKRGEREVAARLLARTRLSRLSQGDRRRALRVLADVAEDGSSRLRWLAQLRTEETDADRVALLDVEIDELLLALDSRELERAAGQIDEATPAARVWLAAAERALEEGDLEATQRALERAARLPLDERYALRLAAVRERLRRREGGPPDAATLPTFAEVASRGVPPTAPAQGTIGVVLPLSGRFARFGEESLHGVLLAAGIFDARAAAGEGPAVRVLIRDTAGRPERASEAVRELADEGDVSAIVGPLLGGECEAAAAAAEDEGIPLLTLSSREEVARDRSQVFRLRTLPREEVQVLVDHAIRVLGAQRFAILYPRDGYGRGLSRLFWGTAEERGGEIVGVASYDPESTDFAEPIRRLVGYVLLTPEEKEKIKERQEMLKRARRLPADEAKELREEARAITGPEGEPLPPIVDFDALFIAESHEKVVLIAPQLAFHEAVGMRLLGPSGWHHPDLVSIARHHVRGALFAAQFYPESPAPFVQSFAERYRATFEASPEVFAAQGFDAANLVLVQLARGLQSREDVREGVLATWEYPGVTGVTSMGVDGNARKRPFLLEVERGRMHQVD